MTPAAEPDAAAELQGDLDRLFNVPPPDFVAARNRLAKQYRAAGMRDEADRLAKLSKPSPAAWALNRLHHAGHPALQALLEGGERFAAAQRKSGGARTMATLMAERRELVATAVAAAEALFADEALVLSATQSERLRKSLEALFSMRGAPRGAELGRLSEDLQPPGFEIFAGETIGGSKPRRAKASAREAAGATRSRSKTERKAPGAKAEAPSPAQSLQRQRLQTARSRAGELSERIAERQAEAKLAEKGLTEIGAAITTQEKQMEALRSDEKQAKERLKQTKAELRSLQTKLRRQEAEIARLEAKKR